MVRAWGALGLRRWNPLLALPFILGAAAFLGALSSQEAPVRATEAASSVSAAPGGPAAAPTAAGTAGQIARPARAGAADADAGATATPASAPAPAAEPAASGHGAVPNPALLPDLRPLTGPGARPAADVPGKPFFTPDPLNPLFDIFAGPFRENIADRDQSNDPTPDYTPEEIKQLQAEGKDLFFSTTAWGQKPSQGNQVLGEFLSCASCHSGVGLSDNRTHIIGPVRERELGHRQTPALFGVAGTAPFGWDGRNPQLQTQARGAITSPLEMHASREPTKRELDALAEFQKALVVPPAVPGVDFNPEMAKRGEVLFRTPRTVIDPSGEFGPDEKVACATCHAGPFFTDGKAHRIALPTVFTGDFTVDPGEIGDDGNIKGFHTPSLLGVRFTSPYFHDGIAGDPTAPSNLLGGGLGVGALDRDVGATGPAAARRALLNNVLPFYNSIRFNFNFTQEELADIAEFLLSL